MPTLTEMDCLCPTCNTDLQPRILITSYTPTAYFGKRIATIGRLELALYFSNPCPHVIPDGHTLHATVIDKALADQVQQTRVRAKDGDAVALLETLDYVFAMGKT